MNLRTIAAALAALGLAACFGPNHSEQLADQVTKAIIANDMRPVESDFNAIVRPKLLNHAKVGALSDSLSALGAYKGVKEDTPSTARPGEHDFSAQFEKATWRETIVFDSDGKIASFHVNPPPDTPPANN